MSDLYISRLMIHKKDQIKYRLFNEYRIHQLVYSFFSWQQERQFLYFLDYGGMVGMKIIMQSCEPPVCDGAWDIEIRKVPEEFLSACRYSFFLRFSPVSKHDGKVTNVHTREADAIQWLCRRGEKYGVEFEARSMEKMNSGKIIMSFDTREDITISYVDVHGFLKVTNPSFFMETVKRGIGPYKGFGLGMLQLRPVWRVVK